MKLSTNRPGIYSDYTIIQGKRGKRKVCAILVYAPENMLALDRGILRVFNSFEELKSEGLYRDDLKDYIVDPVEMLFENGANKAYVCVAYDKKELERGLADIAFYDDIDIVLLANEQREIQKLVSEKISDMAKKYKERICIMSCADTSDAISNSIALANERVVMVGQKGRLKNSENENLRSFSVAAALGVELSRIENPTQNLNGLYLASLAKLGEIEDEEIERCLVSGVSAFEYCGQSPVCIKPLTTKSRKIENVGTTFESLSTILIVDYVMKEVRKKLEEIIKNAKNSKATREKISSQLIVLLEEFLDEELINSYDIPVVYAKPEDMGICIIELKFSVACAINQICLTTQIVV